jgi:alpha-methylacyl-CoA racemase
MWDRERWPAQRAALARVFASRPRAQWEALFEGTDACVTPVLTLDEATRAPHLVARDAFAAFDGALVPAPAPRLSRTPGAVAGPAPEAGQHTAEVLDELAVRR